MTNDCWLFSFLVLKALENPRWGQASAGKGTHTCSYTRTSLNLTFPLASPYNLLCTHTAFAAHLLNQWQPPEPLWPGTGGARGLQSKLQSLAQVGFSVVKYMQCNGLYVHFFYHRLFSEGGNYCPEEVEQYSKKLVRGGLFSLNPAK